MDQTRDDAFGLYQRCISSGVVEYLQKRAQVKVRRSIYTAQVVIWLMILRRLQPKGTLATSVESLLAGEADGLLSGCPRARQKRISRRTGGGRPHPEPAAEAIMLASDDRTGGAAARDLEPGRRVPILSPGRFVTGTGSQPIAAESIPTSRKPAWTRSLAGTAHPGAA